MSTAKVSGSALSRRTAQGGGTRVRLVIGICIQVILVSTVVHAATDKTISLRCNDKNDNWVLKFHADKCSDGQVFTITQVAGYDKETCRVSVDVNKTIVSQVGAACDGWDKCNTSLLSCETYRCLLVVYECVIHTGGITNMPTTDKNNDDKGATIKENNGANATSTGQTGNDNTNMYVVTIVVVSVVAFVAIVFAVTLCLLFFCCQKSPLYRNSTMRRRGTQPQHQEEYDYVDESKFQVLKPSLGNDPRIHRVFCVDTGKATTRHDYQNEVTADDDDDYEEISSNESPTPPKRIIQNQVNPPLPVVSLQSELMKSLKSKPGASRLGDNNCSPDLQDCPTRQPGEEIPVEYSCPQLIPTSHTTAASSSTDRINPDNAEVSDRHGSVAYIHLQPELCIDARSSPSPSSSTGPAVYHTVVVVTDDYAHLARPGTEVPVVENVYDG